MAGPEICYMEVETQFNQLSIEGKKTAIVYSQDYVKLQDTMPRVSGRATLVYELINAYGLLERVKIIDPISITPSDLEEFHSKDYIQAIIQAEQGEINECDQIDSTLEEYELGYDCPIFETVYSLAKSAVSGTLSCVETLLKSEATVTINWCGGWHHAQRDMASGFCYFNDIVLGILRLHRKYQRVLYIDLDLHHGDGVQNAFYYTDKVLTVSFHKFSPTFYPGTGDTSEIGESKGTYFSINIPLKDGLDDDTMIAILDHLLPKIHNFYRPHAIVVQCGADGLVHDPMDSFNLTGKSYVHAIGIILGWKLPLLVVGGGGYNYPNTAKVWTQITALVAGVELKEDIPEHDQYLQYGPDFTIEISPGYRPNLNIKNNYANELIGKVDFIIEELGRRTKR